MDRREILFDPSGLHVCWYFWLRVLDEVNRSNRYGSPFGLLLLDAECQSGVPRRALDEAASLLARIIRVTDVGGRLAAGSAGVLLVEQDADGAPTAAARILGDLAAGPRGIRWRQELLLHPRDAAEISHLLASDSRRRDGEQTPAASA
jgi:hypothetical protein